MNKIINHKSQITNPPASPCEAWRVGHKFPRVLVGLSGGVDSSVTAAMLKKQGYDVVGVFLIFTRMNSDRCTNKLESENKCCNYESLVAARQVAEKLEIPFYVMDASKQFKKEVVDYFIKEYDSGRTPNPCVVCNKKIKFGWMLQQAKKLGCDYVATGHYARIKLKTKNLNLKTTIKNLKLNNYQLTSNNYCLFQAKDKKKDQSYFLWQLDQEQLSHTLFPIGDFSKEEVREIAKKWKLPSANKQESQDLCFISTADKADFIANYADKLNKPGDIVNFKGNILGKHKGLCYYTVGQRHGLGVQLKTKNEKLKTKNLKSNHKSSIINHKSKISSFQPAYVIKLDVEKNQLVVGFNEDLDSFELIANGVNWIAAKRKIKNEKLKNAIKNLKSLKAKIRYGSTLSHCHIVYAELNRRVTLSQDQIKVTFVKPQRAVTPGQSIVFYSGEELIGGGVIQ